MKINIKQVMTMFDVVALGELLIDFTPAGKSEAGQPLFEVNPGGAPANVLAAFAKFGGRGAFLGMVGNDRFGLFLRETLKNSNIDVTGLKYSKEVNTTLAFVHLDRRGDRSFSFYRNPGADLMLAEQDLDYEIIKNSRIFHFGSISMTDEPARSATLAAVKFAKVNHKLISYDPNYRPLLWKNVEQAKATIELGLKYADILKISDSELELLTGNNDLEQGSALLFNRGIKLVLVTLGAKGCFYRYQGGVCRLPTYAVKTVDTTGAGDAFLGAVLYYLSANTNTGTEINGIKPRQLEQMIDFANAAGALATTKKGAIPALPGFSEVEQCRKQAEKYQLNP
jgi:fructokinase